MLRNSRLFDKSGKPKLTADNSELMVRIHNGLPMKFKECVERAGARVEEDVLPTLRVMCENRGLAVPSKPSQAVLMCVRLRVCYELEYVWLQTKQMQGSGTDANDVAIAKLTKRFEKLMQSKKECSLVNDKLKSHRELEVREGALLKEIARCEARISETRLRMHQLHLTGFLRDCFNLVSTTDRQQLYYLLSKHQQGVVKTMPRNQLETFNQLEHFQSLYVDLRETRSQLADVRNKLAVSSAVVYELLAPAEEMEAEKVAETPVLTAEALGLELPDSWDE